MNYRSAFALTALFLAPSCIVYDASLLEDAEGGSIGSGGGSNGDGDGDGDITDTGGSSSGGSGSGGEDQGSGGNASGGSSTGGSGTGGGSSGDCDAIGSKTALTGADSAVTPLVLETFSKNTNNFSSSSTYDGFWFAGKSAGSTMEPIPPGSNEIWKKSDDVCSGGDGKALHITGDPNTSWGASYDAQLKADGSTADLSAYDAIAVWVRSSKDLVVNFNVDYDGSSDNTSTDVTSSKWGAPLVFDLPSAVSSTEVQIIKLAIGAPADGEEYDLWVDDITFFKKAP